MRALAVLLLLTAGCRIDDGGLSDGGATDAGPDAGRPDTGPDADRPSDVGPSDAPAPDACVDDDADGHCQSVDCDDLRDDVSPGAEERCDEAVDEDCDGVVDEGCPWHFGRPSPLVRLHGSEGDHYSPILVDERTLWYRPDDGTGRLAIGTATRAGPAARWERADGVEVTGAEALELFSFSLSADGLELVVEARDTRLAEAPATLLRSRRDTRAEPFRAPVPLTVTTPSVHEFNPHLSRDGRELFFVSTRSGTPRIVRSVRGAAGGELGPAMDVPLGETLGDVTPFLTDDGLTLFFARFEADGSWRIHLATREDTSAIAFTAPEVVPGLSFDGARSFFPFVSQATAEVYFVSDRPWSPARAAIWRARVCREGPCSEPEIECEDGTLSDDRRHCYRRRTDSDSWSEARARCAEGGGSLVTVHSQAEWDVVRDLRGIVESLWLGGDDRDSECNVDVPGCRFRWATGEPFLFSRWGRGEPNDDGEEDCLEVDGLTGDWNDEGCGEDQRSVCENELFPW